MSKTQNSAQDIGERLSVEFQRLVPLAGVKTKPGKKGREELEKTSEKAMAEFFSLAEAERQSHRLGVIARARVAWYLQQRLLQLGYASPLVKQVLFALLISAFVGGKSKPSA